MNFDQLKVIWDTETQESHYAINEEALHGLLREKSEKLHRFIYWQVFQTYASSSFVILVILAMLVAIFGGFLRSLPSRWDVGALFFAAAGWIYFAGAVYFSRLWQRKRMREAGYTASMRDELERDIEQVDFEIEARRRLWLGFLPPYIGAFLFTWVVFRLSGTPEWGMIPFGCFMAVAYVFETRSQQKIVNTDLEERKRELLSLRETLLNSDA